MSRTASLTRTTTETDISLTLSLDGSGRADIATGIGFLDHMLTALTRHALFDLTVKAKGDLHIDFHHTTEDVGIVLGAAFAKALGDKRGIRRFGHALVPMDEALAEAAVDISGRPFLAWDVSFVANARTRLERRQELDRLGTREQLDREGALRVREHLQRLQAGGVPHRDVILLAGARRDRVDARRMAEHLVLGDERRGHVLRDHEAGVEPAVDASGTAAGRPTATG